MSGRNDEGAVTPVRQPEHVLAEDLVSAGPVPDILGLKGWKTELLGAGGVHLLPDNLLDLAQRAPREG